VPVLSALVAEGVRCSIDTRHAEVAEAAVAAGATLVNDVSASLWPIAAEAGVGWVALHMQGEPRTMQQAPRYDDVLAEVRSFLLARAAEAAAAGVTEIWIDPGIGFGKTVEHNLALLNHLEDLVGEHPVLVGTSRKGFLGTLTDGAAADDRLEASLATAVVAAAKGAAMVRVHDVRFTVDAMRIVGEEVVGVGVGGAAR
jgi:dihydropteroate synthase